MLLATGGEADKVSTFQPCDQTFRRADISVNELASRQPEPAHPLPHHTFRIAVFSTCFVLRSARRTIALAEAPLICSGKP